ncbi:MAG TPA: nucleotidyl transferase AbiEii/AbiGii toxin family protein [Thermoanaerobaculia bacterium]|nr:nucleotidyl transferase AbiEii/AbiGii toxin family protein [Thermoanaerobaculia bacterium]
MRTVFDLSGIAELQPLAEIVRAIHGAADDETDKWLIVGATARELILRHAYKLDEGRRTEDLDIAMPAGSWHSVEVVEKRLIAGGAEHARTSRRQFKLHGWKIDILPFGGIEEDGVVLWPPDQDTAMSVVGFEEASQHAFEVILPGATRAFVASPPGLLILKLIAWSERHLDRPHHDAVDLRALLQSYAGRWNEDRLYDEADDLLQRFEYDNELAGAALIGRDSAAIAFPNTLDRIRTIVARDLAGESFGLAADMGGRVSDNINLLRALLTGLQDAALSRR